MNQARNPSSALGTRVFRYDPDQRKVLFGVAALFLACALAFPILRVLDETAVESAYVFLASPALVAGAFTLAAYAMVCGRIALEVHPQGFVDRGLTAERRVAYGEVAAIRYRLVHVVGGAATYNRGFLRIRLRDGSVLRPTLQLASVDEAIGDLFARTLPVLGAEAYAAIAAGGTVLFGPYALSPAGVTLRGRSVAWARAAIDQEAVDPRVRLLDVDPEGEGYAEIGSVPESEIDNPHVLVAVAERLRAEALRRGRG